MYFSDGSAAQQKNRKNVSTSTMNNISVSLLNPTSDKKGTTDGMEGTGKRLAAKMSLQKAYNNQKQTS
jgi:hypothetical protein